MSEEIRDLLLRALKYIEDGDMRPGGLALTRDIRRARDGMPLADHRQVTQNPWMLTDD